MGRHRRNGGHPGFLRHALEGHWTVGASISAGSLVLGLVVSPLTLGRIPALQGALNTIEPLWWTSGLVFGAIALWRGAAARLPAFAGGPDLQSLVEASPTLQRWAVPGGTDTDIERFCLPPEPEQPRKWAPELLLHIDRKRFEELCRAYYRELGIPTETIEQGGGQVGIRLHEDPADSQRTTVIVRCQNHALPIGVWALRELRATMAHEQVDRGCFMTCGVFSTEARRFAEANRIRLLDGALLLKSLRRLPDDASRRLMSIATEGAWPTPSCPHCGARMAPRQGARGTYWACEARPPCPATLTMRETAQPGTPGS